MKTLLSLMLGCTVLSGCDSMSGSQAAKTDSRFELTRFNVQSILVSDIKTCKNTMHLAKLGEGQLSDENKMLLSRITDVWSRLNADVKAASVSKSGALVKGEFLASKPEGLASIFAEDASIEAKAEACGEVAGQAVVKVGLVSLAQSIDLAEATNPGIFEKMGYSLEQVKAGVKIIEGKMAPLYDAKEKQVIDCVAISQSNTLKDAANSQFSDMWVQVLNQKIEKSELSPLAFSERSAYWRAFVGQEDGGISSLEGFDAQAASCKSSMTAALNGELGEK